MLNINTSGYYGGAHEESWSNDVLFSLASGEEIKFSSLILESKKNKLIDKLNDVRKTEFEKLKLCLDDDEDWNYYSKFKIEYDYIEFINFSGENVYLNYEIMPYAIRACEPYIHINISKVREYIDDTLFD